MTHYSPDRRTALVFSGTAVHGAYHAGVLRALHEGGVKIDVVAGHGMGAGAAALAAIDGASHLWEADGVWSGAAAHLYGWKRHVRLAGRVLAVLLAIVCFPLVFLAVGLLVYPLGLLLQVVGLDTRGAVLAAYSNWLLAIFTGQNLPTILPRLAMVVSVVLVVLLLGATLVERWRSPVRRRSVGGWWWRLFEAPLDVEAARALFVRVIAQLVGGGGAGRGASALGPLGQRYAAVLADNLGQPGFRELLLVATDLDTQQDLVGALLREPFRGTFFASRTGRERRAEVLDLTDADGQYALELLAAALTPPLACTPQLITFGSNQFWRGETHRLCDRPGALARLLVELEEAGVTQVIVVSAVAPATAPHRLQAPGLDPRSRLGEFVMTGEGAGLREAMALARLQFQAAYLISPAHNPVGPFATAGAYDEASDRWWTLGELLDGGYEDAYRQFIEPVVGASGEHLGRRAVPEGRAGKEHADGPWLFDETDPTGGDAR